MRQLTEDERIAIINAVQALVGRLDRAIPSDGRQAAYRAAAELFKHEYQLRYGQRAQEMNAPLRVLPAPPPTFYPPVRQMPAFDPFQ